MNRRPHRNQLAAFKAQVALTKRCCPTYPQARNRQDPHRLRDPGEMGQVADFVVRYLTCASIAMDSSTLNYLEPHYG